MDSENIKYISQLYRERYGHEAEDIRKMAGAGSSRIYYNVKGNPDVVACKCDNRMEYDDFIFLDKLFRERGVRVPEIYATDEAEMLLLQEDLGNTDLLSVIKQGDAEELIIRAVGGLVRIQTTAEESWRGKIGQPDFDSMRVMWDLNYFKYEFVKILGIPFDEYKLQQDFNLLAKQIENIPARYCGFMYRDFQSRNVMVKDNEPWYIDFQSGMYGPCLYDAVSFLWQAKAGFDDEFRKRMVEIYADEFCAVRGGYKKEMLKDLDLFVLLRTLQVLGAYGLRGLVERKAHFIESIPQGIENLRKIVKAGGVKNYPELQRICKEIINDKRFVPKKEDRLVIEIYSFSYKKGYPANFTGNGGGFMFDCRALPNPGRYPQYKHSTGRDEDVKEFFSHTNEMVHFLCNTMAVIEKAITVYAARGFTHLQIGYGCTGGQHRSVFCAESAARNIAACIKLGKYPLKGEKAPIVHLIHREQGIDEYIK